MSTESFTIIGLLLTASAVIYQAAAYYHSRRETTLKMQEMSALLVRLEREVAQREQLERRHKKLHASTLKDHANALHHASELAEIHHTIINHLSLSVYGCVLDLQAHVLAIGEVLRKRVPLAAEDQQLLAASVAFCQARIDQIAVSDAWDQERMAIERPKANTLEAAAEYVKSLTAELSRLKGKYTDLLGTKNAALVAARIAFSDSFNAYSPDLSIVYQSD